MRSFALVLCIAAAGSFEPARAQQDFVAANELALKGDLKSAISLYQQLLDQGVRHEDLYFNLGNAYAQDGQLAQAVVAYERALRLQPNDKDAKANLDTLRRKMGASDKPAGGQDAEAHVAIADFVEPIVAPMPLPLFTWIALGLDVLLFACLLIRRAAGDGGRRKLSLVAALALVGLLFSAGILVGHAIVARDPRAVVIDPADVKEGPHVRFKSAGRVPAGTRVRILSEESGFVQILRQDGSTGWIPAKDIVRV
jgi:tetratricopeptide (TPR) repeat protein